jgi:hypothetical protein
MAACTGGAAAIGASLIALGRTRQTSGVLPPEAALDPDDFFPGLAALGFFVTERAYRKLWS